MLSNHNPERIRNLDSLRGVAAITVLLYHYTQRFGEIFPKLPKPAWQFALGRYGVHLFFIISGFVIILTLNHTRQIRQFIRNRGLRLYPAYWLALLITFFMVHWFPLPDRVRSSWELLVNFTMVQHYFGVKHVDGVYWTLSLELSFYTWMAWFYYFKLLSSGRLLLMLNAWLVIINAYFYFYHPQFVYDSTVMESLLLLRYGHLFFAGIAFYLWRQTGKVSLGIIAILTLGALAQWQVFGSEGLQIVAVVYLISILFIVSSRLSLQFAPLLWLGKISYSLYLCHQYVGYICLRAGYEYLALRPAVNIMLATVVSLILASLIHYLIEQPALNYFRSRATPLPEN